MAPEPPEQWLTREVDDLLRVGAVGLVELVWLLEESELTDAEKAATARAVTTDLVGAGRASVYELSWPANQVLDGPIDVATLPDTWPTEPDERYLALIPEGQGGQRVRS